jgi:hypothetical protein
MQIDLFLENFKVLSPNVSNDRWTKAKLVKGQKRAIWAYLNSTGKTISLPCKVSMTRFGVRTLDFDNLVASFKHVRDAVADYIHPGLIPGQADNDPNITWVYADVKCHRNKCGVQLRIE